MQKKNFQAILVFCSALVLGGSQTVFARGDDAGGSEMVSCADGMLRIDATNVKPEDLTRDIGDKCGIKIVVFGEAFDDKPIGVKFQPMPVRMGIQRVLRIANMPNFILHFDNKTSPRIVELDLIGKKGGERQLTSVTVPVVSSKVMDKPADKKPPLPEASDILSDKAQGDFMKVMDEMMKAQESGEEPDPAEVLRIFKAVVPQDILDQIPPDVRKEIEDFEKNPPVPVSPPAAAKAKMRA